MMCCWRFYVRITFLIILYCGQCLCEQTCGENKKIYKVRLLYEEQVTKLLEANVKCSIEIETEEPPNVGLYCNKSFINGICWPYAKSKTEAAVPCPEYINGFDIRGRAKLLCTENGTWELNKAKNTTFIDFSECINDSEDDGQFIPLSSVIKEHVPTIQSLYVVGYAVSLASLLLAVFLMLIFRRLRCQRNTIHVNLFISFCLRAVICLVKDVSLLPQGMANLENHELTFNSSTWQCKFVLTVFQYLLTANYMWIFVEGLYLHTLIFYSMTCNKKKIFKFYIIFGWASPVPSVVIWVIVRLYYEDSLCWGTEEKGYYWILRGFIVFSIVVNFIIFLRIIGVVLIKLNATNRNDPNRHRKLARSTLVLIPLFGVYYIIFIAIPDCIDPGTQVVLLYIEIIFSSFQGFVVALLFCFLNTEVKDEIKKVWRIHLLRHQNLISTHSHRSVSMTVRDNATNKLVTNNTHINMHKSYDACVKNGTEPDNITQRHDPTVSNVIANYNSDVTLQVIGDSTVTCDQEMVETSSML